MFWENECTIGMLDNHGYQKESAQGSSSLADNPKGYGGPVM